MWNGATCQYCNGKACTVCQFTTPYVIINHYGKVDYGKMELYKINIAQKGGK